MEWKHMFQQAQLGNNRLLEAKALEFRKALEKEFDIDTAKLVK